MDKIIFVTGNERKIGEARLACEPVGIEVVQRKLDMDEIQSHDSIKVTEHKVRTAYELAGEPVVVGDTYWSIPALNGFPGAYMKDVAEWFSEDDFLTLVANKADKRVSFTENIAYYDGSEMKVFSKQYWGKFMRPSGVGNSIERVAAFNGQTIGDRRVEGKFSHEADDFIWADFVQWYTAR